MGTDGIIPVMISAVLMYSLSSLITDVCCRHRRTEFYDILRMYTSKIPAGVIYIIYTAGLIYIYCLSARDICAQITIYMAKDMPAVLAEMFFICATAYAAFCGIAGIANIASVTAKPLAVFFSVLILMCAFDADIKNMLPAFTHGAMSYKAGIMHICAGSFPSVLCLPCIIRHTKDADAPKIKRQLRKAFVFSSLLLCGYYIIPVSVLGADSCREIVFPAINIMHMKSSPGMFLNRYEIVMVFLVVMMYFISSSLILLSALSFVRYVTSENAAIFITFPAVAFIMFLLHNRSVAESMVTLTHIKGYMSFLPLLLGIIFLIMKGKNNEKA